MTLSMTRTINSRQDFLNECTDWCRKFNEDNKVLLIYVRRGPKPKKTVVVRLPSPDLFPNQVERYPRYTTAVQEGKRKPQGVVAAYRGEDGIVRVGWSLCRKTETFHSKVGLKYALERAIPIQVVEQQLETIQHHYLTTYHLKQNTEAWEKDRIAAGYPPQSVRKVLKQFLSQARKL